VPAALAECSRRAAELVAHDKKKYPRNWRYPTNHEHFVLCTAFKMTKRKHTEAFSSTTDVSHPTWPQRRIIAQRIIDGQNALARAIKFSKGLERQKLGRRLKTAAANKDTKDKERIENEIEALKLLEPLAVAEVYLNRTLLRIKRVSESGFLPESVKEDKGGPTDTAKMNVMARLWNAKPTKETLASIVSDIKSILGLEERTQNLKKQEAKVHDDLNERPIATNGQSGEKDNIESKAIDEEEEWNGFSDSSSSESFTAFDSRVVGSDEETTTSSDEEEDAKVGVGSSSARGRLKYTLDPELSPSPSPSPSPAPSLSLSDSGSPEAQSKNTKPAPQPADSTFLPSLTMGGYWSGSEEASDIEDDVAPRKNRRGQRARQKIAELKFGTKAKHLQKGGGDRNSGWDARKGATSEGDRFKGHQRGGYGNARDQNRGPNPREKRRVRDDEGKLHPSWEAAKKRKEEKAIPAFQGKKIVFD